VAEACGPQVEHRRQLARVTQQGAGLPDVLTLVGEVIDHLV
jgi:hypothetical protein